MRRASSIPSCEGTGLFIRKLLGRIFLSRQRWRKFKWHMWLDMHSPAFKYLRVHVSTSDPCRSFILRKMLFFLLLMLFRSWLIIKYNHQKSLFICLFDLQPGGKRYETTWAAKRTALLTFLKETSTHTRNTRISFAFKSYWKWSSQHWKQSASFRLQTRNCDVKLPRLQNCQRCTSGHCVCSETLTRLSRPPQSFQYKPGCGARIRSWAVCKEPALRLQVI